MKHKKMKRPCESQAHKDHLTSKLKYMQLPSYLLCTLLIFPFHLIPAPMHHTGLSFCFFPGFLAMFTLMSSKNNNWPNWCVSSVKNIISQTKSLNYSIQFIMLVNLRIFAGILARIACHKN